MIIFKVHHIDAHLRHHLPPQSFFQKLEQQPIFQYKSKLKSYRSLRTSGQGDGSSQGSVSGIIAEVLAASPTQRTQNATDLLKALDTSGSLTTTVLRTWYGPGASLDLKGQWLGGVESRRTAMLAVYQERLFNDNNFLKVLVELLTNCRPGYLSREMVDKILDISSQNEVSGALEALGPTELTLMAVALVPIERLEALIQGVVAEATDKIKTKAWSNRDAAARHRTSSSLQRASASMKRHLHLSLLRLRLWSEVDRVGNSMEKMMMRAQKRNRDDDEGGSAQLHKQADGSVSSPSLRGGLSSNDIWASPSKLSADSMAASQAEPMFMPMDKEQLYFTGRVETYCVRAAGGTGAASCGATSAGVGRSGSISFGRGPPGAPAQGHVLGRIETGVTGRSGFGGPLLMEAFSLQSAVHAVMSTEVKPDDISPGVTMEVSQLHRMALLQCVLQKTREILPHAPSCTAWYQQHQQQRQRCVQAVRVKSSSSEQVGRRIQLQVEGEELEVLRRHALSRGRSFLMPLGGLPGIHPLGHTQEWEYASEAPTLWSRYLGMPTAVTGITLKLLKPSDPPPFTNKPAALPSSPIRSPSIPSAAPLLASDAPSTAALNNNTMTSASASSSDSIRGCEVSLTQCELLDLMLTLIKLIPSSILLAAHSSSSSNHSAVGASLTGSSSPPSPLASAALQHSSHGSSRNDDSIASLNFSNWSPSDTAPFQMRRRPLPLSPLLSPLNEESGSTAQYLKLLPSTGGAIAADTSPLESPFEVRWRTTSHSLTSVIQGDASSREEEAEGKHAVQQEGSQSFSYSAPVPLTQQQLQSLVSVLDTASSQLPQLVPVPYLLTTHDNSGSLNTSVNSGSVGLQSPSPQIHHLDKGVYNSSTTTSSKTPSAASHTDVHNAAALPGNASDSASSSKLHGVAAYSTYLYLSSSVQSKSSISSLLGAVFRQLSLLALLAIPALGAYSIMMNTGSSSSSRGSSNHDANSTADVIVKSGGGGRSSGVKSVREEATPTHGVVRQNSQSSLRMMGLVADPGSVKENEMNIICNSIQQRVTSSGSGGKLSEFLHKSGDSKPLQYQVVVSRAHPFKVLGFMPLTPRSVASLHLLPLAASELIKTGGRDLPQDESGVVVLHVDIRLTPAAVSPINEVASSSSSSSQGATEGTVPSSVPPNVVSVTVRPWLDLDSVATWMMQGADLQPPLSLDPHSPSSQLLQANVVSSPLLESSGREGKASTSARSALLHTQRAGNSADDAGASASLLDIGHNGPGSILGDPTPSSGKLASHSDDLHSKTTLGGGKSSPLPSTVKIMHKDEYAAQNRLATFEKITSTKSKD
ncbi:hypothetical protein CEUSTIGMA_g8850.t1 [Chlamydomonas eustigma]|uniref:Uncharacterized protein n=1 Tax=Chlamydomonas eustigma TaxID=1157962 RepID=A0A250XF61_9CHLO|nr:hypothetical protein CEUSTIGMA_g8850.t1 [Chlamydomonas eustigma]|eukprot:GAX81420.1 hypothetical protein CEUSTIGMA_g8850.t1 [Chlamydomonas eustigma]